METDRNIPPNETYALIVGIETYSFKYGDNDAIKLGNLNGPAKAAIDFADWLVSRDVPPDNIHMFVSPLSEENEDLLKLSNKVKSLHNDKELFVQAASEKSIKDTIALLALDVNNIW
jgi:hypothetical protein